LDKGIALSGEELGNIFGLNSSRRVPIDGDHNFGAVPEQDVVRVKGGSVPLPHAGGGFLATHEEDRAITTMATGKMIKHISDSGEPA
jgi:hypothetical protein